MPSTTLYLVRHGEASGDGADPALSTTGRDQAIAIGGRLLTEQLDPAPLSVLHSSRRRAVQTARVIADPLGVGIGHSDDLEDRTPVARDLSTVPERYHDFLSTVLEPERDPDGERLDAALASLGAIGSSDRTIVAVTHAFVVAWFVRAALGAPPWRWISLPIDNASLTVIRWSDERGREPEPRVFRVNDTGHLR